MPWCSILLVGLSKGKLSQTEVSNAQIAVRFALPGSIFYLQCNVQVLPMEFDSFVILAQILVSIANIAVRSALPSFLSKLQRNGKFLLIKFDGFVELSQLIVVINAQLAVRAAFPVSIPGSSTAHRSYCELLHFFLHGV